VDVVEVNGYTIKPWAKLSEADLSGANLSGANLLYAKLSGADLSGANLRHPQAVKWARADEDTRWPEGFDPKAAGVIFEE